MRSERGMWLTGQMGGSRRWLLQYFQEQHEERGVGQLWMHTSVNKRVHVCTARAETLLRITKPIAIFASIEELSFFFPESKTGLKKSIAKRY